MVILNKILKYPLYFVLLFTQAKSFKANPIIGSVILNVMGLHIIRLLIARGIFKFKLLLLMPLASKADRDFYAENGYLLKENILSEDDFESLRQDVLSFDGEVKRSFQGDSLVYRAFLDSKSIEPYKYIQQFIYNNKIISLNLLLL